MKTGTPSRRFRAQTSTGNGVQAGTEVEEPLVPDGSRGPTAGYWSLVVVSMATPILQHACHPAEAFEWKPKTSECSGGSKRAADGRVIDRLPALKLRRFLASIEKESSSVSFSEFKRKSGNVLLNYCQLHFPQDLNTVHTKRKRCTSVSLIRVARVFTRLASTDEVQQPSLASSSCPIPAPFCRCWTTFVPPDADPRWTMLWVDQWR